MPAAICSPSGPSSTRWRPASAPSKARRSRASSPPCSSGIRCRSPNCSRLRRRPRPGHSHLPGEGPRPSVPKRARSRVRARVDPRWRCASRRASRRRREDQGKRWHGSWPQRVAHWRSWASGCRAVPRVESERRILRAEILPAPDTVFSLRPFEMGAATLSPDGRHLAWTAINMDGTPELWVRALDRATCPEARRYGRGAVSLLVARRARSRFLRRRTAEADRRLGRTGDHHLQCTRRRRRRLERGRSDSLRAGLHQRDLSRRREGRRAGAGHDARSLLLGQQPSPSSLFARWRSLPLLSSRPRRRGQGRGLQRLARVARRWRAPPLDPRLIVCGVRAGLSALRSGRHADGAAVRRGAARARR